MFFKSVLATALAAVSVLGAPLEQRQSSDPYFTPSALYHYNVGTGAITPANTGLISKSTDNRGNDITTLFTFTYPREATGKQCQFAFYLDSTATARGSKKLDLFTSLSPAPGATTGWGPGNQRNIHLGRLSVDTNAFAKWDATYNAYLTQKTPCKSDGTQEGFELVGVYDHDFISWDKSVAGPRIIYT